MSSKPKPPAVLARGKMPFEEGVRVLYRRPDDELAWGFGFRRIAESAVFKLAVIGRDGSIQHAELPIEGQGRTGAFVGWLPMEDGDPRAANLGEQAVDDEALDQFTTMMRTTIAAAREDGRQGWHKPDTETHGRLISGLDTALHEGDWVSVANYAMFLWMRGTQAGTIESFDPKPFLSATGVFREGKMDPGGTRSMTTHRIDTDGHEGCVHTFGYDGDLGRLIAGLLNTYAMNVGAVSLSRMLIAYREQESKS